MWLFEGIYDIERYSYYIFYLLSSPLTATQHFLLPLKAKLLGFCFSVSKKSIGYIKDKSPGFFLKKALRSKQLCQNQGTD